jgi:predicted kinase
MTGFPGSGKSTLAKKICENFGCQYLSSDEIRQQVFRSKRFDSAGDQQVGVLRQQAYLLMYDTAVNFLNQQKKVTLDATHLEPAKRKLMIDKLTNAAEPSSFCYVLVKTPLKTIKERMKQRTAELHNPGESMYDAWQRVYGYFTEKQRQGIVSWPDPVKENIDCITHEELTAFL